MEVVEEIPLNIYEYLEEHLYLVIYEKYRDHKKLSMQTCHVAIRLSGTIIERIFA